MAEGHIFFFYSFSDTQFFIQLPQRLAALHAVPVKSSGLFRQAIPPQAVHGKTRENGVFPGTAILPPSGQGASLPFLR